MSTVLFLAGSPRVDGNTDDCVSTAAAALSSDGHHTHTVRVHDRHIERCSGCRACMRLKRCVIEGDDFTVVWDKVKEADLLVVAAPVYWYGPPGALKDFIDRAHGEFAVPQPLQGLTAALLSVAGDDGCWEPHEAIMASWLRWYGAELRPGLRILARERNDALAVPGNRATIRDWAKGLLSAAAGS